MRLVMDPPMKNLLQLAHNFIFCCRSDRDDICPIESNRQSILDLICLLKESDLTWQVPDACLFFKKLFLFHIVQLIEFVRKCIFWFCGRSLHIHWMTVVLGDTGPHFHRPVKKEKNIKNIWLHLIVSTSLFH